MLRSIFNFAEEGISQKRLVMRNTFWLFLGQVVGRFFRAFIVIYAARVLGAEHWGAFSYALGIVTFLTVFSDIGINGLITKETSRNEDLRHRYISTALFIKLALVLTVFLILFPNLPRLSKIPEATMLMPILFLVFLFDTVRDLGSALSRALQKMHLEAFATIFTNFVIVVFGFLFLFSYGSSRALAVAYALGSGLGMLWNFYILRRHFRDLFRNFDGALIKPILVTAWPFGLLAMLGALMLNTDIIMIGWLRTATEVGYYSAAQKIIQLLYVLPTFLATSIFPLLSRLAKENPERARQILGKSVSFMILVSLPISIMGILAGPFIIPLLFGAEYAPAILPFQILMGTILVMYPSMIIGNAAFAYDQEKHFIPFVLLAALSNIILNAILIPIFGIAGAAMATIGAQFLSNVLMWRRMRRVAGFRVKLISFTRANSK